MHTRLLGALLAILVFFALNLCIHLWSNQSRKEALVELTSAIERQLCLAGVERRLSDA